MPGLIATAAERPRESFDDPARGDVSWFTLFSADRTPTDSLCGGITEAAPHGVGLALHRHAEAEVYYILNGVGVVTIDGVEHPVKPGDAVFIPGDSEHGLRNTGEETLRLLYVFPAGSFADIVYRFTPARQAAP